MERMTKFNENHKDITMSYLEDRFVERTQFSCNNHTFTMEVLIEQSAKTVVFEIILSVFTERGWKKIAGESDFGYAKKEDLLELAEMMNDAKVSGGYNEKMAGFLDSILNKACDFIRNYKNDPYQYKGLEIQHNMFNQDTTSLSADKMNYIAFSVYRDLLRKFGLVRVSGYIKGIKEDYEDVEKDIEKTFKASYIRMAHEMKGILDVWERQETLGEL